MSARGSEDSYDGAELFDFAVFKRTKFGPTRRIGFEFRTEFFNLFNHPQFGPPGETWEQTILAK